MSASGNAGRPRARVRSDPAGAAPSTEEKGRPDMRLPALMAMMVIGAAPAAERFVPSGRIDAEDITVLMAVDAPPPEGTTEFQRGGHGKFFVNCPPDSTPAGCATPAWRP